MLRCAEESLQFTIPRLLQITCIFLECEGAEGRLLLPDRHVDDGEAHVRMMGQFPSARLFFRSVMRTSMEPRGS